MAMTRFRIRLDDTDRKILSVLAQDASLTNRDLARRIGVAPSTYLARVRRLEEHDTLSAIARSWRRPGAACGLRAGPTSGSGS